MPWTESNKQFILIIVNNFMCWRYFVDANFGLAFT